MEYTPENKSPRDLSAARDRREGPGLTQPLRLLRPSVVSASEGMENKSQEEIN